jgi:hypothetical protein
MGNSISENLYLTCSQFLAESSEKRWLILEAMGIARYGDFLTQMPLNEANITCLMRFFGNPSKLKFPNLQGADLSELMLNETNWIRGNLTDANLRVCSLINADLLFVNFSRADLRFANLTGATLNETIWLGAMVEGCQFGVGIGLSKNQRRDLQREGAIFWYN